MEHIDIKRCPLYLGFEIEQLLRRHFVDKVVAEKVSGFLTLRSFG